MKIDPHSREAEAKAEMAATRLTPVSRALLVGAGLALLGLGVALETVAAARGVSRVLAPLPAAAVAGHGPVAANRRLLAAARETERRYDEESVLARAIRPWGQLALTALARYGNEEAIVGRSGWLGFRTDQDHLAGVRRRRGDREPADAIVEFAAALARREVALLVVLAPAKPAVHPAPFVRGGRIAPLADAAAAELLSTLAARGIAALDPTPLLAGGPQGDAAYLATDTHWRPEGMEQVAREIAMMLRAVAPLPVGDPEAWRTETDRVEAAGDCVALLGLPGGARLYPPEKVEIARTSDAGGAPWTPSRGAPVLLLGDSFSAIYSRPELGFGSTAGLAERLSHHLGLPVDRILRNSGGASETRAALAAELARDPERLAGVRAVVWELAAREVSQGEWRSVPLEGTAASGSR